ncbi:MAG TPA: thioredoxin family protein [Telluria sp.]|nr:thioredoxin family protein [Telluria sp.]
MGKPYETTQPERSEIDAMRGVVAVDFGTNWCGYCNGAAADIEEALAGFPQVKHIKAEDGPGRPLGRSFRVKLWPTVVVMKDGVETGRVVRPAAPEELRKILQEAAA